MADEHPWPAPESTMGDPDAPPGEPPGAPPDTMGHSEEGRPEEPDEQGEPDDDVRQALGDKPVDPDLDQPPR